MKARFYIIPLLMTLVISGCVTSKVKRELYEVHQISAVHPDNKYVKAHMKDGDLYVLNSWLSDTDSLYGTGNLLNHNRQIVHTISPSKQGNLASDNFSKFSIPISDIALVETNDTGGFNPGVAVLGVAAASTLILAAYCAANPKACFGSCPTFYTYRKDSAVLQAEGFSSSISRHLEKVDVDHVRDVEIDEGLFKVLVKNEALETHMIHELELLVCEKSPGTTVLASREQQFYELSDIVPFDRVNAGGDDVSDLMRNLDDQEWFSLADSTNLLTKEKLTLSLQVDDYSGQYGLVIANRQSLMTTFLFYQSLALFGESAGHYFAEMENENSYLLHRVEKMFGLLGGIEIWQKNEKGRMEWISTLDEMGPIALDQHIVPLKQVSSGKIEIEIRMTQGLWRINKLSLARILGKVNPHHIKPHLMIKEEAIDSNGLSKLIDPEQYLITMPGDEYEIEYEIPFENRDLEIFIRSKGYYIEWMREQWMAEQDLLAAYKMYTFPKQFYRKMAPFYKDMESEMEQIFWNSRYVKQ